MADQHIPAQRLTPPPRCFDDLDSFREWQAIQRRCYSAASICEDCTAEFEHHMQAQARCDRWHWQTILYAGFSKSSKMIGGSNGD